MPLLRNMGTKSKRKQKKVKLKPGSLRERVKKGDVSPSDTLAWLAGQSHKSVHLIAWLRKRVDKRTERPENRED